MEHQNISTENRILEAAEKEFIEKGFAAARTTSIAEAAGVTHAMLHYYFRTKEKLFDKVITEKLNALAHTFQINIDDNMPLAKCVKMAVESHFDFVRSNPALPRFLVCEVFTNPVLVGMMVETVSAIAGDTIRILQANIDRSVAKGECRYAEARSLLLDIVSLNVFPVLAMPLIGRLGNAIVASNYDSFLDARRKENVDTVLAKLGL